MDGCCEKDLKQFPELLDGKTRIARNTAHRERVYGIVPRNRYDSLTIAHHDMLALPDDAESSLPESSDGVEMINARNAWQA
jgi:hypothetical protein